MIKEKVLQELGLFPAPTPFPLIDKDKRKDNSLFESDIARVYIRYVGNEMQICDFSFSDTVSKQQQISLLKHFKSIADKEGYTLAINLSRGLTDKEVGDLGMAMI